MMSIIYLLFASFSIVLLLFILLSKKSITNQHLYDNVTLFNADAHGAVFAYSYQDAINFSQGNGSKVIIEAIETNHHGAPSAYSIAVLVGFVLFNLLLFIACTTGESSIFKQLIYKPVYMNNPRFAQSV